MSEGRIADPRWALVWCRGPDAKSFLQGLLSADLEVAPGSVVRSFLLQPQGKLEAILWVLVGEREVGLVVDQGVADDVVTILNRFKIRVDAQLERSADQVCLLLGEQRVPDGAWRREGDAVIAGIPRRGTPRTLVVGPTPEGEPMSADDYTSHRISSGEPVMGVDVDGGTIPQETGLVPESVSFTKGCYLGQELVARIDSRGHVNQRLMLLEADSPFAAGDVVESEGRSTVVTSAAPSEGRWIGLAMVRRETTDGATVLVQTSGGEVTATAHELTGTGAGG